MKKLLVILSIFVFVLGFSLPAFCADPPAEDGTGVTDCPTGDSTDGDADVAPTVGDGSGDATATAGPTATASDPAP
ncbi:MAG: hypothetical protein ABIA04_05710 [Pseudomonadota bacterium]